MDMDQINRAVVSWTDIGVVDQNQSFGRNPSAAEYGLIDLSRPKQAKDPKASKAERPRATRRKTALTAEEKYQAKRKNELERIRLIGVYEEMRDELKLNNREIVDELRKRGYEITYANFQRHVQGNASVRAISRSVSKTKEFYDEVINNPYMNMSTEQIIHAWLNDLGLPYHEFGVRSPALKEFAAIVGETYTTLWRWRVADKIPTYAVTRIAKKIEKIKAGLQRGKVKGSINKQVRTQASASP